MEKTKGEKNPVHMNKPKNIKKLEMFLREEWYKVPWQVSESLLDITGGGGSVMLFSPQEKLLDWNCNWIDEIATLLDTKFVENVKMWLNVLK